MLVEPGHERLVHHILVFSCNDPEMSQFVSKPEPCFDRTQTNFSQMMQCTKFVLHSCV